MGTINLISPGEVSSAAKVDANLLAIQALGTAILAQLSDIQTSTLIDYERRLSAITLRQSRAAKVLPSATVAQFTLSDWSLINQTDTTATVRVDTQTATLREKRLPGTILVASTAFTTSTGNVQTLDQNNTLFRVTSSSAPTATFVFTLSDAVQLSLMTFTLSALASTPDIQVSISPDGVVYTPANNVQVVGSTLTAWFPASSALYVQLLITPTHADDIGGDTYTFGVTDVSGTSVSYALAADLFFNPIQVSPQSASWVLDAPDDPGLQYYVRLTGSSFDSGFVEYRPGDLVPVPGVSAPQVVTTVDQGGGLLNPPVNGQTTFLAGVINSIIDGIVYNTSVQISRVEVDGSLTPLPIIHDYQDNSEDANDVTSLVGTKSESWTGFAGLTQQFAVVQTASNGSSAVYLIPFENVTSNPSGGEYVAQWIYGPQTVNIELYVHISTSDRNQTPVFTGLSLEEN